jgi:hypothetical protein
MHSVLAVAVLASISHISPFTQVSMQEGVEELELEPQPWAAPSTKPATKRDLTTRLFSVIVITLAPWGTLLKGGDRITEFRAASISICDRYRTAPSTNARRYVRNRPPREIPTR